MAEYTCCVCLELFPTLVRDGRCSEGYCVECLTKIGNKCPNCRQQFPWCIERQTKRVNPVQLPIADAWSIALLGAALRSQVETEAVASAPHITEELEPVLDRDGRVAHGIVRSEVESGIEAIVRSIRPPFNLLITGRAGTGKTTLVGNLLLREEFFLDHFDGRNIYIFQEPCDPTHRDIIRYKNIPSSNITTYGALDASYDMQLMRNLYARLEENFRIASENGDMGEHTLVILDNLKLSRTDNPFHYLPRCGCNRTFRISIIITSQSGPSNVPLFIRDNFTHIPCSRSR